MDEFADDEQAGPVDENTAEEGSETTLEEDEFAEETNDVIEAIDDEFSELNEDRERRAESEEDAMNEIDAFSEVEQDDSAAEPDDLMADFDISADADVEESDEPDSDPETDVAEFRAEQAEVTEKVQPVDNRENEQAIAEINRKLAELLSAQGVITGQISEISDKDNSQVIAEELEGVHSELKKLKRKLKTVEERKPVLVYVALGVAIFALLVGAGLGMVGLGADSKVSDLSDTVIGIEEEVEVIVEKDIPGKIDTLTIRMDKLTSEIETNATQLTELKKVVDAGADQSEFEKLNKQFMQMSEQNMQMGATIEALQLQLDRLASNRLKARKSRKKPVRVQEKWQVNLISFRQQWYAKRKAAEFEKKGIPVVVKKVLIKGNTWYRLSVKGFNSRYEAAAYAAKVKKSLNLTSVWVAKG